MLEVLQFGRDASVAESWLAGQEPLVRAAELGSNVDEVESLIKRHEAFEKLAAAWEDRFVLLEKLTTVSREMTLITNLLFDVLEWVHTECSGGSQWNSLTLGVRFGYRYWDLICLAGGARDPEEARGRGKGTATPYTTPSSGTVWDRKSSTWFCSQVNQKGYLAEHSSVDVSAKFLSNKLFLLRKHRTSLDQTTLNQSVSVNGVHSDNDTSQVRQGGL